MRQYSRHLLWLGVLWLTHGYASTTQSTSNYQWLFTASIGDSHFIDPYNKTLQISNTINDHLHEHHHDDTPSINMSLKRLWENHCYGIRAYTLGPTLYYQTQRATGDVLELDSTDFNNYNYTLSQHATSAILEGTLIFDGWFNNRLTPSMTAGFGASIVSTGYHDHASPGIPVNSEFDIGTHYHLKAAYTLSIGLHYSLNQQWLIGIEETYIHAGNAYINKQYYPQLQHTLKTSFNSTTTFLSLSHTF